ncbi:MAG: enoyl-CoA hydratase [Solirubrobacteraceae bacterium]
MTLELAGALRVDMDGDALWATINRPEIRNAINLEVIEGFEAMMATAHEQRVKVVVLRGAGRTFCSGADLHELHRLADDPQALRSFMRRLGAVLDQLERAPWVTVAVVEGYAVAGGCELLLACDIVLTAFDARIGDRHVEYGLVPAAGASVRLPRAIPPALARYLLLTGEMLSGQEAVDHGLATIAVEAQDLEDEAERIASRLLSRGHATLKTVKAMLADGRRDDASRLGRELDLFLAHVATSPDARAGLAAFRDGVRPVFDADTDVLA